VLISFDAFRSSRPISVHATSHSLQMFLTSLFCRHEIGRHQMRAWRGTSHTHHSSLIPRTSPTLKSRSLLLLPLFTRPLCPTLSACFPDLLPRSPNSGSDQSTLRWHGRWLASPADHRIPILHQQSIPAHAPSIGHFCPAFSH